MAKITRRDLRIADYLTKGKTPESIAEKLMISVSEVDSTMRRLSKANMPHALDSTMRRLRKANIQHAPVKGDKEGRTHS